MSRKDENLWVHKGADRGKWCDVERARQNRRKIQYALSSSEVSERDLIKWALFAGALYIRRRKNGSYLTLRYSYWPQQRKVQQRQLHRTPPVNQARVA
jgi:hypothetical protein